MRVGLYSIFAAVVFLAPMVGRAQEVSAENPNRTISLTIQQSDHAAASQAVRGSKHYLAPKAGYGMRASQKRIASPTASSEGGGAPKDEDSDGVPAPGYYTTDLSNPGGGPVISSMLGHPLFVNTLPALVGNPGKLLDDLGKSHMVHVIDQYVGRKDNGRYKAGTGALVIDTVSGPLYDSDIIKIVHAAAALFGDKGYHAEYHVFFGKGQDVCFDDTSGVCYSPDNPNTFYFCAYHSAATYSDLGQVLYSVEPYQAVPGCEVGSPSPNGLVVDSTMSVLSHEYFESITDPDANGDGWIENVGLDLSGAEIGDVCQNTTFVYPSVKLNGTPYELQGEYSNKYHACAYVP